MKKKNRYGLSRDIDAATRRKVRKRCGFGCVICGRVIVEYHHFAPEFKHAKVHDSAGISLLCKNCHGDVGAGIVSREAFLHFNANPMALRNGFASKGILYLSTASVPVMIGTARALAPTVIKYEDQVLFGFSPPEVAGGPVRLSMRLTGPDGRDMLRITENEWRVGADRYDITVTSDRLEIRDKPGEIILETSLALDNGIHIRRLEMSFNSFRFHACADCFQITTRFGQRVKLSGTVTAAIGFWLKADGGAFVACPAAEGGSAIRIDPLGSDPDSSEPHAEG